MSTEFPIARVWLAAALLLCVRVSGQDTFLETWNARSAQQPADVQLVISTPKVQFHLGEEIKLELNFTSREERAFSADTRLQDRVGRMNYVEEFVAAPAEMTEDPLQGLPGGSGALGGLSGGPVVLSERPFTFERVLNDWVRFRKPGEYRVYVLSHRVRAIEGAGHSDYYIRLHATGKPVEVVSNILTLRIDPAPASWVRDRIAAAKGTLADGSASSEDKQRARRVLRFLDSPEAAAELVLALTEGQDVESYSSYMGVLGSPYRSQLLPLMERRLVAADQPVWDRYLDTLAQLAVLVASGGPMGPYPQDSDGQKSWHAEQKRREDLRSEKQNEYAARLVSSLSRKQPQARAVSLNTLLSFGMAASPAPPWLRDVMRSLIHGFRDLPVITQRMLLESRWSQLKGPGILRVLRDLVEHPPSERFGPPIEAIALQRLYELSPEEGRKIILAEIRQPTKRLPFSMLAMLPDASLPELNDVLADRFDPLLILRYATGDIVKRVEETYQARNAQTRSQNLPSCAGPLAFYFLKYDPPFGERLLRDDFAKTSAPPVCYDIGFQFLQLGRWAYSPALEQFAIESLASSKVPVKRGAAEVLGRFGSPAAQKPLWDTMEYFRSWWKGRESELNEKIGEEGTQLERALRTALARADAWILEEPELSRLLDLCSTEWCRIEVSGWIAAARAPVAISFSPSESGWSYTVGQYGPGDGAWLDRKLRQFPDTAVFTIQRWAQESQDPALGDARSHAEEIVRRSARRLAGTR